MSAFKFEGNIPITGITAHRLADTETIKNAFEIHGPLIEKILAVCQSPVEANKWVDFLGRNSNGGIDIKRNTSFSSGAHLQPSVSQTFQTSVYHEIPARSDHSFIPKEKYFFDSN